MTASTSYNPYSYPPPMDHNHNAYVLDQGADGQYRLVQVDHEGNRRPERGVEHPVPNLLYA